MIPTCVTTGRTSAFTQVPRFGTATRGETTDGVPVSNLEEMKVSKSFPRTWRGIPGQEDQRTQLSGRDRPQGIKQTTACGSLKQHREMQCGLTPGKQHHSVPLTDLSVLLLMLPLQVNYLGRWQISDKELRLPPLNIHFKSIFFGPFVHG